MSSNKKNDTTGSMEKEILKDRKFSMAEAIGRANAGSLKGASPIPKSRQALMDLEAFLEIHLVDPEGSLGSTIVALLSQDLPLLDKHRDHPLGALREFIQNNLSSESVLQDLVRQTDVRWGRDYQERPLFNKPGQPDHPDDPYTCPGVRTTLQNLLDRI